MATPTDAGARAAGRPGWCQAIDFLHELSMPGYTGSANDAAAYLADQELNPDPALVPACVRRDGTQLANLVVQDLAICSTSAATSPAAATAASVSTPAAPSTRHHPQRRDTVPGSFKNKAMSVGLALVAGYFVITNPTGSAHAVTTVAKGVLAFLAALAG